MLGYIQGKIKSYNNGKAIVLLASGQGYELYVPPQLAESSDIECFTTLIIRENSQELFGFPTYQEKSFFEKLLNVKGVGPKSAYQLYLTLGRDKIIHAVMSDDKAILQKVPGIGKKSASQIILDLKGVIERDQTLALPLVSDDQTDINSGSLHLPVYDLALEACKGLGFKQENIVPLLKSIDKEGNYSTSEEIVQEVLRRI